MPASRARACTHVRTRTTSAPLPPRTPPSRIVKLVRAIRKGWLKTAAQKEQAKEQPAYLMWGDDGQAGGDGSAKTATGLSYIPPAKPKLPGHAESYNPPAEYVPTEVRGAGGGGAGTGWGAARCSAARAVGRPLACPPFARPPSLHAQP